MRTASSADAARPRQIQKARGEGLRPSDIAVLSLGGQQKTALCARNHIGPVPVRRADAPDAGHVIAAPSSASKASSAA